MILRANFSRHYKIAAFILVMAMVFTFLPYSDFAAAQFQMEVVIIGEKFVIGEDVPEVEFTFKLQQLNTATEDDFTEEGIELTTQRVGEGEFTFTTPALELGTYYFQITEVAGSSGGWEYDGGKQIVKVVVGTTNGKANAVVTYPGGIDGLEWISPGEHENLPFGSANHFSVIAFEDFSVQGADVESGLAVGGDLSCEGGYSLGKPYVDVGLPIAPHDPRLLVKGNIDLPNLEVWGGSIVVSEYSEVNFESYIRSMAYIGEDPYYNASASLSDFIVREYPNSVTVEDALKVEQFFSSAEDDLKELSLYYRDLSGNRVKVIDVSTAMYEHPAYINGSGFIDIIYFNDAVQQKGVFPEDYAEYDTIVYNLTLNGYDGERAEIRSTFFSIPDDYEGNIIINVLPGGDVNELLINSGAVYINGKIANWNLGRDYADRIIWNFPSEDLAVINTRAHEIIGSVLAPFADFKPSGGGVDGTLIAKSVTATGGWETHSTTLFGRWNGDDLQDRVMFTNNYEKPEFVQYPYTVKYYRDSVSEETLLGTASGVTEFDEGYDLTETEVTADLGEGWIEAEKPENYITDFVTYTTITTDPSKNIVIVVYVTEPTPPPTGVKLPLGWMRSTEIEDESFKKAITTGSDAWTYEEAFANTPVKYFENVDVQDKANEKAENNTENVRPLDEQLVGIRHIWDEGDYFPKYKDENGNVSYNWASWEHWGVSGSVKDKGEYSVRRFAAYFEVTEEEIENAENVFIAPEDELGNMSYLFPINDNVFVFVNGQLAYWGGTDVVAGNNQYGALNRTEFMGQEGIKVRNGMNGVFKGIYPHTDGWCIDIKENGAAVDIKSLLQPGFNRIDIITDEYWEGGGMNRLFLFTTV